MTERDGLPEILVTDDNPLMARLLTEIVADEGYLVATVPGESLIETALAAPPRLLILDVLMPGIAGPEVCRRLRADARTRDIPIIFVSALPPAALEVQLRDCAYDALIAKPFDLDEVTTTVRHLLARASA